MTWPETIELTIDGIAQGGDGVGRWGGRVVFAEGTLPGEQVLVRLRERHESYARGVVSTIITAAPERVPPRLPDADHMPWQHIAYPAQLRFKRQILADQLAKIGGLPEAAIDMTLPAAAPWGYRAGARFHVSGMQIGYHIAGTRDLRPLTSDPLLLRSLNEALAALRALLRRQDGLEEIVLRASETHGYVVAALHGRGNLHDLAQRWRARYPALAGVVLPTPPPVGADHLTEELGEVVFQLRPGSFFQVNLAAAATLLQLVREGLSLRGDERLLDLYCGVGTFTLPLAATVAEVIGVEEHAAVVADAQASAAMSGVANVSFLTGRVEALLPQITPPIDAVVLDPPRRGCHPTALDGLVRLAPPRIIYVSCHPATLARDLRRLGEGGYRVTRVTPVDLFPQTAHIESVTILERMN